MNYRLSHTLLWAGLVLGFFAGFLSYSLGFAVMLAAAGQAVAFYRCPHCRYCLLDVHGAPSCCPHCGEDLPWP